MRLSTSKAPAIGLVLCMAGGAASAEQLAGPEIERMIAGQQVMLSTPFGIGLPLRYRQNGSVIRDVSGISAAAMFAPREEGRWWVEKDRLCQKWPTWYKGRQFCFTITSLGNGKIAWLRDDGTSGTARVGK